MEFVDRQLTCMDCSQLFTFTAGEQDFYDRKGFKEEPKRCKNCREARKLRRNGDFMSAPGGGGGGGHRNAGGYGGQGMDEDDIGNRASANGSGGGGGGGAYGGGGGGRGPREVRDFGGGGRGPREMFDATCAQCGVQTRVPFRPVAGRPVYCRDCYSSKRGVGY